MSKKDEAREKIKSMSRDRFERICINLLERMGFEISTVKSVSGDVQVEAEIERDGGRMDYLINCTRSDDFIEKIKDMEKLIDENIKGFILTPYKIDQTIDSQIEVAGLDELYKLLGKFDLLDDLELEEELRVKIKEDIERADRLLGQEKPSEAIDKLIEVIKKDKGIKESWYLLSKAYDQLKEYEKEVKALETAVGLDEGYIDAWKAKGEVHYELEEYDDSIQCFKKILEIEPGLSDIWNNIGLCYMKKEEYDEALRALDNALSLKEDFEQALLNKALIFERQGKIDKTIEVSEKLMDIDPENPEYHYISAAYLYKKGELKEALDKANRTLELDPDDEEAQELKDILEQQIDVKEAERFISKDLGSIEKIDTIKQERISHLLWKMGEIEESVRYTDKGEVLAGCILFERGDKENAARLFEENENLWNLEEINYENKSYSESKEILNSIKTSKGDGLLLKEKIGITSERLGDLEGALKTFESILEREEMIDIYEEKYRCFIKKKNSLEKIDEDFDETDDDRIKNLMSIVYYINNEYKKSLDLLSMITDIENPIYFNNLGCVMFSMERFEDALKAFEKAVEKDGGEPVYLNNYSFCLIEEDRIKEALKYLERSIELDDSDPISWYYRGIALKRDNDDGWRESIKRSLNLKPDFKKAEEMLR